METEAAAVMEDESPDRGRAAPTQLVLQETEAVAVMEDESLILASSQDTEVQAAAKDQESLIILKKLLFSAKNFSDKSVAEPVADMKKLMTMDMSRSLIDWMDKVLSSCYNRSTDGKVKIRSKKDGTTSNALELISDETRSSACKMIKMPISLMRALDFYAMAKVPEDCEPFCFKHCADNKNPLMIEVGYVYRKYIVIALKEMVQSNAEKTLSLQETKSQAYYALSMDCATIANFRGKLKLGTSMHEVQKFTEKIMKEQNIYEKHANSERSVNPCLNAAEAIGYILCTNPTTKKYWSIDSGASHHISGKSRWITNVRPIPKEKKMCFLNAASKKVQVSGIGDIISQEIRLYNVYLSYDLEDDELYVSIGQLTGEGYTVLIDKGEVTIRLAKNFNHIVGTGSLDRNAKAYKLKFFNGSVLEKDKVNLDEKQGAEYDLAEGEWVLDSGCHNHITCKKSFLNKKWKMRKGKKIRVAGSEQLLACKVKGNITEGEIRLKDVYLCEESYSNLISVCQLDVLGYNFLFSRDHCHIRYKKEKNLVGLAHADGGSLNYYVEFLHSKE